MNQVHSFIPKIFVMLLSARQCSESWDMVVVKTVRMMIIMDFHLLWKLCVTIKRMLISETGALASGPAISLAL